jgi:hypothetical protein
MRAVSIVNCQSTARCLAFVRAAHAAIFGLKGGDVGDATVRLALSGRATQLAFRHIEPAPMLRCVHELDPPYVSSRFVGNEGLIEGTFGMRVEVVTDQVDSRGLSVPCLQQVDDFMRPIDLGSMRSSDCLPETGQRFGEQEEPCCSFTFVFVVHSFGVLGGRRDGDVSLTNQLHRLLVPTDRGAVGILGFMTGFQHLLHLRDEPGVSLGRNRPVLDPPLGHAIFLSVCRTVLGLVESTTFSSTS